MNTELKNEYIKSVLETTFKNSESIKKYLEKNISNVVNVSAGLLSFWKPSIKTHFCYAYDEVMDCHSGTKTFENACKACDIKAITFFNDNLEELNRKMNSLEEKIYFIRKYYNNDLSIEFVTERYMMNFPNEIIAEATKEDVEIIKEAIKEEIEKFTKRLQTYYKRYGLSKLRTWTYSIND